MQLAVSNASDLFSVSEDYFRLARVRCADAYGPTYIRPNPMGLGQVRCVIGNVLITESTQDVDWLRAFRGNAQGVFAGWFSIHPLTKFSLLAYDLQVLHDTESNWVLPSGGLTHNAWQTLIKIKEFHRV